MGRLVEGGWAWGLLVVCFIIPAEVACSSGDQSTVFQDCFKACREDMCETPMHLQTFRASQPMCLRLMGWNCLDECDYICMWTAVESFIETGQRIQQFHGKWPFVRLCGVQEPASTLFSILNGLAHATMIVKFRREVPKTAPLYYLAHGTAVVSVNAWLWSSVFHSRDLPFTEMMDYFGALSLVLYLLFSVFARLLVKKPAWLSAACGCTLLAIFLKHIHHMMFVKFDYDYNMLVNVTAGVTNSILWLSWCFIVRQQQPFVWKAATVVIATNVFLCLELGDFAPVWWIFDAHSLWHAGTSPLPLLWYRFMIDDCRYLDKRRKAGDLEEAKKHS